MDSFPRPFSQEFLDDLPYDPEVLFLDRLESIDREASRVVCRMPTHLPLPIMSSQRNHPVRHPIHVAGALLIQVTGALGFVHAWHLEDLRHKDGWVGYGTTIKHAAFRKLVPPGEPILCACTQLKQRRLGGKVFATYKFLFTHLGEVAYESEQSAIWVQTGEPLK